MKTGSLKEYFENKLPSEIEKALRFLKKNKAKLLKIKPGKYSLKGENVFLVISEYETQPSSEKKAESHKKYIDIQYILSGRELVEATTINTKGNIVETSYNPEEDVIFYSKIKYPKKIKLKEDIYAIFFPEDIHKPGCNLKSKNNIKKAIIKIAAELF